MIHIERSGKLPIYQQIYEQIKRDILSGAIPEGAYITSTRALAKELQVGRNSVENAYSQLVLEGYVTSVPGSGYWVNNLEFNLHHTVAGVSTLSYTPQSYTEQQWRKIECSTE